MTSFNSSTASTSSTNTKVKARIEYSNLVLGGFILEVDGAVVLSDPVGFVFSRPVDATCF